MRQHRDRHRHRKTAGFTIVELLVAVAIIAILLGVSFLSLAQHQKNVKQLELDTIAKELFVAAQNQLTAAESQGLTEALATGGGAGKFGNPAGKTGEYYVVVGDSWDAGNDGTILGLMLPFASIDETVRTGGSYIIHYNKDSAQILNVFYASPKRGRFSYTFTTADYARVKDLTGAAKKKDRREYNNGKAIIGWYGAEGGEVAIGAALKQPRVTVSNEERLTVTVDDSGNSSNTDSKRILALVVKGETSGATRDIYLKHPEAEKISESKNHWDYKATGGGKYTVVFDDVTISRKHFNDLFNDSPSGKFIPGENLILLARTSYQDKTGMSTSASKRTNSLFATQKISGGNSVVSIKNIRHMENLSEQVSSYDSFKGSKIGQKTTQAIQSRDLSWKAFRKTMAKIKEPSAAAAKEKEIVVYSKSDTPTQKGTFASISVKNYILEYDGHGKKITDVIIKETEDKPAGLFGDMKGGKLTAVRMKDFSVTSKGSAGALAGKLDGTKVAQSVVYNSRKAEKKEIKACNADGADLSDMQVLEISGAKNVGGLIGEISGSGAEVKESAAAVYVRSDKTAGGLIGSASDAGITDSYAGGHTKTGAYIASAGDGSF